MFGRNWTRVLILAVGAAVNATAAPAVAPGAPAEEAAAKHNADGVTAYEAKRWDEAIDAFTQAYEIAPGNNTVRRNLCNAYQAYADEVSRKADYAAASEMLETAIGVDPKNPSPLVQLASYYLRLNMTSDAIYRLKEAVELDPKLVAAHELLGDAYYRDNDLAAALEEWEWVQSADPTREGIAEKIEKASREGSVEARFGRSGSHRFQISYTPGTTRDEQGSIVRILERAFIDIGQKFGGVYPPTPINVIVYTAKDFTTATQVGEHVGALYDGKIRVPLKDESGHGLNEEELTRRLYHEYTHVVVRFLTDDNVPWWVNEGLAETFSRNDNSPEENRLLKAALEQDRLFSLSALQGDQLTSLDPDTLRLAYLQSYATVSLLWKSFGPSNLASFMSALAEGKEPEEALQECYRRNYSLLEREVANAIAKNE